MGTMATSVFLLAFGIPPVLDWNALGSRAESSGLNVPGPEEEGASRGGERGEKVTPRKEGDEEGGTRVPGQNEVHVHFGNE